MSAGTLGVPIYFITVSWTAHSGRTYVGWHTWSMHIFYPVGWITHSGCTYMLAGMLGVAHTFISVGWTAHSGHTYMSAGMLGVPIYLFLLLDRS